MLHNHQKVTTGIKDIVLYQLFIIVCLLGILFAVSSCKKSELMMPVGDRFGKTANAKIQAHELSGSGVSGSPASKVAGSLLAVIERTGSPVLLIHPAYRVEIYDDCSVMYSGYRNVKLLGPYMFRTDPSVIAEIKDIIANFQLGNLSSLFPGGPKNQTTKTSFRFIDASRQHWKSIEDHAQNVPATLVAFQIKVESSLGISTLTGH